MNTKTVKEKVEEMIEEELRTMGAIIVSWNGISPMYYVADKIDKLYRKELLKEKWEVEIKYHALPERRNIKSTFEENKMPPTLLDDDIADWEHDNLESK